MKLLFPSMYQAENSGQNLSFRPTGMQALLEKTPGGGNHPPLPHAPDRGRFPGNVCHHYCISEFPLSLVLTVGDLASLDIFDNVCRHFGLSQKKGWVPLHPVGRATGTPIILQWTLPQSFPVPSCQEYQGWETPVLGLQRVLGRRNGSTAGHWEESEASISEWKVRGWQEFLKMDWGTRALLFIWARAYKMWVSL